ncbi:MAG: nucleoside triphosphate pyrophosphohydrolase [Chloroflexota bacterium]
MSGQVDSGKFAALRQLIARLRSPEGCPWDRKQTHASLKTTLLEECYEALQAIEAGSPSKLCEELGDLLLQIMLNSQIAEEAGEFDVDDVIQGITAKIVRRHPHIFGEASAGDAEEVAQRWESLKQQERGAEGSILDSVPGEMPALAYSHSIQRRASGVGFDWEDVDGVIDKLVEEVQELRTASDPEQRAREFGDVLFTLVNVARRLGVDLEMSLRGANERFRRRFQSMEEICRERGLALDRLSLQEWDKLWNEAKGQVGG